MTESEWLACTDPDDMLNHLGRRVSGRKLRLFACACYRHVPPLFANGRVRAAVEASERYADRLASKDELSRAQSRAFTAMWTSGVGMAYPTPRCARNPRRAAALAAKDGGAERGYQAVVLRDLFGNPFHRAALDASWHTPDVLSLARVAYEERALPDGTLDLARLAVLADALEDAGCTNAAMLVQLRSPGPHVRGCWPVDVLLAKGQHRE